MDHLQFDNVVGDWVFLGNSAEMIDLILLESTFSHNQMRMSACGSPHFCDSIVYMSHLVGPKNLTFLNRFHKLSYLQMKYSGKEVMAILWDISRKELFFDFGPCRIAGERDEDIRPSIVSDIGHGILCSFMHKSRPSSRGLWKQS